METRDTDFVAERTEETTPETSTLPDQRTTIVESGVATEQDSSVASEVSETNHKTITNESKSELNQTIGEEKSLEIVPNTNQITGDFENNVTETSNTFKPQEIVLTKIAQNCNTTDSANKTDVVKEEENDNLINTSQNCNTSNVEVNFIKATEETFCQNGVEVHSNSEILIPEETLFLSEKPISANDHVINNISEDCKKSEGNTQETELIEEKNEMVALAAENEKEKDEKILPAVRNCNAMNHSNATEAAKSLESSVETLYESKLDEKQKDITPKVANTGTGINRGEGKPTQNLEIDSTLTNLEQEIGTSENKTVSTTSETEMTLEKLEEDNSITSTEEKIQPVVTKLGKVKFGSHQKNENIDTNLETDISKSEIQIISTEKEESKEKAEILQKDCNVTIGEENDTSASEEQTISKKFESEKINSTLQKTEEEDNNVEKDASALKEQTKSFTTLGKIEHTSSQVKNITNGVKNDQLNIVSNVKDVFNTENKSSKIEIPGIVVPIVDEPKLVTESSTLKADLKKEDNNLIIFNAKSDVKKVSALENESIKSAVIITESSSVHCIIEKDNAIVACPDLKNENLQESSIKASVSNCDMESAEDGFEKSGASGELESSMEDESLQSQQPAEIPRTQSLKVETVSSDEGTEGKMEPKEGKERKPQPEETADISQQVETEEVEARLERRLAEFLGVTRPCQVQLDTAEVLGYQGSPPRRGRAKKMDGRWRLGRPPKIPDELREEWEGPQKRQKMEGGVKKKEKKKTDLNTPNRTSLRSTRRCEEKFLEFPVPLDTCPLLENTPNKKAGKQKRELANLTIDCKIITRKLEKPIVITSQTIKLPTKKLGRPKKVQPSDSSPKIVMKKEIIVSPKIKKKLGRPRKIQDGVENSKKVVEVVATTPCKVVLNRSKCESNLAPKKKLGRPRKIISEVPTIIQSNIKKSKYVPENLKKKMGRPRKIKLEFSPLENKSKFSPIVVTPKKKMGRPRKIDSENSKIISPKIKKIKSPKFSPELKIKKKMGRPRKIPLEDQIIVKSEPVELSSVKNFTPKKIGRPRKVLSTNILDLEPKNKRAKKDDKLTLAQRRRIEKMKSELTESSVASQEIAKPAKKKGRPKKILPGEPPKELVASVAVPKEGVSTEEKSTEAASQSSPTSSRQVSPKESPASVSKERQKKKSPKLTKPCKVILSSVEVSKYLTRPHHKPQKRKWSRSSSSDLESSWVPPTPFYDPTTQENMVMCSYCSKKFPERNKYNLRRHMACIHDTEPFCKVCKYILHNETMEEHQCRGLSKQAFKQYSESVSNNTPPVEVSNSDVVVNSEPCFDETSSSSSNKNILSLSCPYCSKKCSSNFSIKRHMKTFHGNQSFCRYCWMLFPDYVTLNYHLDTCEQKPRKERKSMKLKMHWENKKHGGNNTTFINTSNNIVNIVEESCSINSDIIISQSPTNHELFSVPDNIQESQYDNSEFYSSNHNELNIRYNNIDESLKTIEISQWKMLASTDNFHHKKVDNLQNGFKTMDSPEWNVSSVVSSPSVSVPVDMMEFHPSPVVVHNSPIFSDLEHDSEAHKGTGKVYHML